MVVKTADGLRQDEKAEKPGDPSAPEAAKKPQTSDLFGSSEADKIRAHALGVSLDDDKEKAAHQAKINALWCEVEKEAAAVKNKPWNSTKKGKAAIRTIARGTGGAIAYSIMQVKANKDMGDYNPEHTFEQIWNRKGADGKTERKYLQVVAKIIDNTFGKGIEHTVNLFGGNGSKAVKFRPTRPYYNKQDEYHKLGRSLGHEYIGVQADFWLMSIGDNAVQCAINAIDPNTYKAWWKEEKTTNKDGTVSVHHHFDAPEAIKQVLHDSWNILSNKAGEDVAVGIPYVLYLRGQRNVINHFSPGFGEDSDRSLNGGSYKVKKVGDKVAITGDFQREGMLDLVGRFNFYNFLTIQYQDLYHHTGQKLTEWWKQDKPLFTLPHSLKEIEDDAYKSARYLVTTFIKTYTYMTPASLVFAALRTPQSKDIGMAVHQDTYKVGDIGYTPENAGKLYSMGALHTMYRDGAIESINASGHTNSPTSRKHPSHYFDKKVEDEYWPKGYDQLKLSNAFDPVKKEWVPNYGPQNTLVIENNPFNFTPEYDSQRKITGWDKHAYKRPIPNADGSISGGKTNIIGAASNGWAHAVKHAVVPVASMMGSNVADSAIPSNVVLSKWQPHEGAGVPRYHTFIDRPWVNDESRPYTKQNQMVDSAKNHGRRYAKAAVAYAPYFVAKDFTRVEVNTPRADIALQHMVDGVFHLNLREAVEGGTEYVHAIVHKKLDNPEWEAEAREATLKKKSVLNLDGSLNPDKAPAGFAAKFVDPNQPIDGYHYMGNAYTDVSSKANGEEKWASRADIVAGHKQNIVNSRERAEQQWAARIAKEQAAAQQAKDQNAPSTSWVQ